MEETEIKTAHLRLAARTWGREGDRPVLAVHGWLDNAASFDSLAPLLRGLHLVALDLPGHGHSERRPPGVPYHFVDFIADVLAAADALAWERFSLLGHSLGGAIASVAAAVAPERVERVALIEGLGPLSESAEEAPARLADSIAQMARVEHKRMPIYRDVGEAARARERATGVRSDAALALAARGTRPAGHGVTWRSDPRLLVRSPLYLTEEQVLAFLARIEAPVLLIVAAEGLLVGRPYMEQRCACVPRLEVCRLPGRHHLHLEDPEPSAGQLNRFLGAPPAVPEIPGTARGSGSP